MKKNFCKQQVSGWQRGSLMTLITSFFQKALCILVLIASCACSKEGDEENNDPGGSNYLIFNSSTAQIGGEGGIITRTIESDLQWQVAATNYYSWLQISPTSGYGDCTLEFAVSPNTTNSTRYAYVEISADDPSIQKFTFCIAQTAGSGDTGGGGNTGGDDTGGGGNTGGGDSGDTQKPSAPTGVSVSNEGNDYIPDVRVRWNAVSNATYYYIYRSSSANGSYSKIGEMSHPNTSYSDSGAPTNGGSAYYKVKAVNSAGESNFSNYAKYTSSSNDDAFAPAYTYGSCTVSGSNMTLRWTNSTGYGYGKATSIVLRVWNPYAEEWQDTNLSATATSATFSFSTKIDNSGYVKAGIVVSNAKGSYTAGAKIYDTKSKKWLN